MLQQLPPLTDYFHYFLPALYSLCFPWIQFFVVIFTGRMENVSHFAQCFFSHPHKLHFDFLIKMCPNSDPKLCICQNPDETSWEFIVCQYVHWVTCQVPTFSVVFSTLYFICQPTYRPHFLINEGDNGVWVLKSLYYARLQNRNYIHWSTRIYLHALQLKKTPQTLLSHYFPVIVCCCNTSSLSEMVYFSSCAGWSTGPTKAKQSWLRTTTSDIWGRRQKDIEQGNNGWLQERSSFFV